MNKSIWVFITIGLASILRAIFGPFSFLSSFNKVIVGGCLMIALVTIASTKVKVKQTYANKLVRILEFYVFILVARSVLFPTDVAFTTYIFSPYNVFFALSPIVLLLPQIGFNMKYLNIIVILTCLCGLIVGRPIGIAAFFCVLFFPFQKLSSAAKFVVVLSVVFDVMCALGVVNLRDSPRSILLEIGAMMAMFTTIWVINKESITKWYARICFFLPILFVLSVFLYDSFILSNLSRYISNEELTVDTRTFLFLEISDNMETPLDWLLGLGFNARYYSDYFFNSISEDADFYLRSNVEVGALQLILKGGILLFLLQSLLLWYSVFYAIKNSNNRFCLSCALFLASYFVLSFIVDFPSSNPIVVFFPWLCCGFCLSGEWLSKNDEEIKYLINSKQ